MNACLRHLKVIACDQFFFTGFVSIYSEERKNLSVSSHSEHNELLVL